jgi:hypothetical protein
MKTETKHTTGYRISYQTGATTGPTHRSIVAAVRHLRSCERARSDDAQGVIIVGWDDGIRPLSDAEDAAIAKHDGLSRGCNENKK